MTEQPRIAFTQNSFTPRSEAICELLQWVKCTQCGILGHPKSIRENGLSRVYTLACNHQSLYLTPVRYIKGKMQEQLFLTFETRKGSVLTEHYTQWADSFLTQYYNVLNCFMGFTYAQGAGASAGQTTATDTGGTSRTLVHQGTAVSAYSFMSAMDAAADATYGMLVGTGTTANSGSTSGMATLIATGNGASQLAYGSMGITTPGGSAPLSMTFTRTYTNNSGGNITINEVGYAVAELDNTPAERFFLLIRDVNAGGLVTVNNGANTTGTYTMSYTIA